MARVGRPKRGPIPSNDPPEGYVAPEVVIEGDEAPPPAMFYMACPRKQFLGMFSGGTAPEAGRRYALECIEAEVAVDDDAACHASFKLVRVYV